MLRFVSLLWFLALPALLFDWQGLHAQVTGPEQDCNNALPVCQLTFIQTQSYQGVGLIEDLPDGSSCLQNEENNSVWYIFTITDVSGGNILRFQIIPAANDDYDFALYDITGRSCEDIASGGLEVRCNYAFTSGPTGCDSMGTSTVEGPGGKAFCSEIVVSLGQTYALLVDNFSSTQFGYTLDFTRSTASILDLTLPEISGFEPLTCDNTDSLIIYFSEPVLCSSLAADGSDFSITGPTPVTIISTTSSDCAGGAFTQQAVIHFSSPISQGGNYTLQLKAGSDGNTIEDNCNKQALPASYPLLVPGKVSAAYTATPASACNEVTVTFDASGSSGNVVNYNWSIDGNAYSGSTQVVTFPLSNGQGITIPVSLIVSSADCADTLANNSFSISNTFAPDFSYQPAEPCATQPVSFTDITNVSATDYLWEFGDGQISGSHNPTHIFNTEGTYTVTFTVIDNAQGCQESVSKTVVVRQFIQADFVMSNNNVACAGMPMQFTDASRGTPVNWTWTFPNQNSLTGSSVQYTFPSTGNYTITLEVDDQYCGSDDTTANISVLARPVFNLGNDTFICLSEKIPLTVGVSGIDSVRWSTGETSFSIEFGNVPAEVIAIAYSNGCPFSDTIFIDRQQLDCSFAIVPSAFSPNNDGQNDLLKVLTKRVLSYEIIIYNRWGQEVYRGTGTETTRDGGWDGTYKGEPQDIGVYTYMLTWRDYDQKKYIEKGNITLIR
ncbi:MAG: hypothetical protein KatS3mg031_0993 [Chitinophagales bacterium]|nr:MAG: hypothetical protein KatS3mg031_0993 [Chitinophagales bacterium]